MLNSPVDCKGLIISKFLTDMQEEGWLEVDRYPAYYPEDTIIEYIEQNPKFQYYIAENEGILVETHAGSKSYFFNTHRKLHLNQVFSTTKARGSNLRKEDISS